LYFKKKLGWSVSCANLSKLKSLLFEGFLVIGDHWPHSVFGTMERNNFSSSSPWKNTERVLG